MKIDFILGSTTFDSVQCAADEIIEKSTNPDSNIIVLVPETNSALIERLLLERKPALSNVSVYSFVRLLSKINGNAENYLTRDSAILCIRKIISDNFNKLVCFKKSAKSVGFSGIIYDTIAQFKASGVTPNDVTEMINNVPQNLKLKLTDIALIYNQYQLFLAGKLLDNCDKLNLLISSVRESKMVQNSLIYIVGFSSLTQQGVNLIEELAKISKGVKVACGYKTGANADAFENEVYVKIKQVADRFNLYYNPKFIAPERHAEFAHIEKRLFAYPYVANHNTGRVIIKECSNISSEVEYIAKNIIYAVKNGFKPNEIAVFCADGDNYSQIFSSVFNDYAIPFYQNQTITLKEHPLFNYVLDVLNCLRKNFEQKAVFSVIKNILYDADDSDAFFNYCVKYAISYNQFFSKFKYGQNQQNFPKIEEVRDTFAQNIQYLRDNVQNCKRICNFTELVRTFLEKNSIKSRLEKLYDVELAVSTIDAMFTEQVFEKLNAILDSLDFFLGDEATDIETFYMLLEAAASEGRVSVLPPSLGVVNIVDTPSTINPSVKMLFVCGAVDGCVPFRQDDCGIIVDSELGSLSEIVQKKIEPTIRTVNRREREKLFELLLLPSEKLILTYPNFNLNGDELKASSVVEMINKLFDKTDFPIIEQIQPQRKSIKDLLGFIEQIRLGKLTLNDVAGNFYYALMPYLNEQTKKYIEEINIPFDSAPITNAKDLFFGRGTVSISQLEKFFECPYLHFAAYGLRLKEREEGGMKALDVGNLLHYLAEKFVKVIPIINADRIDEIALKLLRDGISELEIPEEKNALILSVVTGEAVRLAHILYSDSKSSVFKSVSQELPFGYDDKAVTFAGNIKLVGKIDRVDQWGEFVRIIDYKTGNVSVSASDVYYGRKIQLICYLLALKRYRNIEPGACLYFPIHNEFAKSEKLADDLYKNVGLINDEARVILGLDTSLSFENPKSHKINAELYNNETLRQTGELSIKPNSELTSLNNFNAIADYVYFIANKAVSEIIDGNITPSPVYHDGGKMPCRFCKLKNVCGLKNFNGKTIREQDDKITYQMIADVKGGDYGTNS